jgi:hypothetical protein
MIVIVGRLMRDTPSYKCAVHVHLGSPDVHIIAMLAYVDVLYEIEARGEDSVKLCICGNAE